MKERLILFSAPMVRALLDGSKTQTRRVVKPQPERREIAQVGSMLGFKKKHGEGFWLWPNASEHVIAQCPYGQVGGRLWVRETWMPDPPRDGTWSHVAFDGCRPCDMSLIPERYRKPEHCLYRADGHEDLIGWTPAIHMFRWASRITLEITGVRVERLQDISEADALAEGITPYTNHPGRFLSGHRTGLNYPSAAAAYRDLWESINGRDSWTVNPWVWCVDFRRIKP